MTASEKGVKRETGIKKMMAALLSSKVVDDLLVPVAQADAKSVMPALVASADELDRAVLLGPSFFINTARMAARISHKRSGRRTAVWMRPCEVRAFKELVKLNQASNEELLILCMDCPMAPDRERFGEYAQTHGTDGGPWAAGIFPDPLSSGLSICGTCRACRSPQAADADIQVLFYGMDEGAVVRAGTPKGEDAMAMLNMASEASPDSREAVVETMIRSGQEFFDCVAIDTTQVTDSLSKLSSFFAACINCYNCRTVCPVCYCRECVFNTDVFEHDPAQYHLWAARQGNLRLPSDTLFFHLTRLAHMSHACVGCGQCTRACPSGIPVADLFSTVGSHIQHALNYLPGSETPPPFTVFKKDEFEDAVGID